MKYKIALVFDSLNTEIVYMYFVIKYTHSSKKLTKELRLFIFYMVHNIMNFGSQSND